MGHSIPDIAEAVGRCRDSVYNVLADPEREGLSPRSGRPREVTQTVISHLTRNIRGGDRTARQLFEDLNIPILVSRAIFYLRSDPFLRYRKMRRSPHMTAAHKVRQVAWVIDHVTWAKTDWNKVFWSDEKRFKLDGTDGMAYHWADKRCQERIFQRRHSCGCSLMIWGAFSSAECSELCFVEGRLNYAHYLDILENYLVPHAYFITVMRLTISHLCKTSVEFIRPILFVIGYRTWEWLCFRGLFIHPV